MYKLASEILSQQVPIFTNICTTNPYYIVQKKIRLIHTKFESSKFISNSNLEWWYCILRQSVQYRQSHCSPVQYTIGYIRCFSEKVRKIMVNLIKISEFNLSLLVIDANHCFFRILTTTIQHPPLFLFTTVRSILHAQFGTFRGALYYVM